MAKAVVGRKPPNQPFDQEGRDRAVDHGHVEDEDEQDEHDQGLVHPGRIGAFGIAGGG